MHRRWLAGSRFEQAADHIVMEEWIAAVEAATAWRERLGAQIEAMLPDSSLESVVRAPPSRKAATSRSQSPRVIEA